MTKYSGRFFTKLDLLGRVSHYLIYLGHDCRRPKNMPRDTREQMPSTQRHVNQNACVYWTLC